jgi:Ulp1 family protease
LFRPCILILDSSSAGFHRARFTATLREWLHEEYIAKHKGKKKDLSSKVMKESLVKVPQQPDNIDCSLYMIHFLKIFFDVSLTILLYHSSLYIISLIYFLETDHRLHYPNFSLGKLVF